MAEKKFVVFLTEAIHPSKRQALAEAAAPGLRVSIDKIITLLSRPVGPLTRPSSQAEASRIMRVLHNAGIPVEVRTTDGSVPATNPAARTRPTAAARPVRQVQPKVAPQTGFTGEGVSSPSLPSTPSAVPSPAMASPAIQPASMPNFQAASINDDELGRTMFDVPATPAPTMATGKAPAPSMGDMTMPATIDSFNNQNIATDDFDDDFGDDFGNGDFGNDNFGNNDFSGNNLGNSNFGSNNFGNSNASGNNVVGDDFSDVEFEEDDDFGDMDIPSGNKDRAMNDWDSTLDEDEHRRLVAEREAQEARNAVGLGVKSQGERRGFRFPIAYKLLLAVLLPLLIFSGLTYYFVNTRAVRQAQTLLLNVGDNLAVNLAADISSFAEREGVEIDSAETSYYFTDRLKDIARALNRSVGVQFTDAQGIGNGATWETDLTQSGDFQAFENAFGSLAVRTLQVADFNDDERARAQTLEERTAKIEGNEGNFYVVATPLANDEGTVQVIIAEGQILESAGTLINPILLAAAIMLALAIIIAIIFALAISRNLRRLASTAERISLGDLEEPVSIRGNDETRDLAEAFESMRESLQAAIERLSRRDRDARR